jgi:diguanylate cyclase (GGDEF)-like protein
MTLRQSLAPVSVRTKLAGAFGLALAVMLILGLLAVMELKTVSRFMTEVAVTWMPRREFISEARLAIAKHHLSVTQAMTAPDRETAGMLSAQLRQVNPTLYRAWEAINRPPRSADEQNNFADFMVAWHSYESALRETGQLLALDDFASAAGLFSREAVPRLDAAAGKIGAMLEKARRQSESVLQRGQSVYRIGLVNLIVGFVVALAFLVAAVWWIARNVTEPILRASRVLNRLSAGDREVDISKEDGERRDEIGGLFAAVEDYRRSLERGERLKGEAELEKLRFEMAVKNMPLGLSMFDADRRLIICNSRFIEMYGLPPEFARPGTPVRDIVRQSAVRGQVPEHDTEPIVEGLEAIIRLGTSFTETINIGNGHQVRIIQHAMEDGGWLSIHEDVTEQKQAEARIAHMIRHDALTGSPNRLLLRETTQEALAAIKGGGRFAMVVFDIDDFKSINDTLGNVVGDRFLKSIADNLRRQLGPGDLLARIGGDAFAIVQRAGDQPAAAARLTQSIAEIVGESFSLEGRPVPARASIGVAIAPKDGGDPDRLLQAAELALHRAKAEGRGRVCFFEPDMDAATRARRDLELDLREALRRGEFELYYQPIARFEGREIVGCEALLRWRNPARGLVMPEAFISVCEETGLIVPIGAWALKQACSDAAGWPEQMRVAVNLSAAQFRSESLLPTVIGALAATGLPARRLELEITESTLLADNQTTLSIVNQLRALGVRIVLDDFGTGYSSLNYLRLFPIDKIKIDRSFVHDLSDDEGSLAIIRAVAGLSSSLGMTTTAEGVETEAQFERLRKEGFTEAQGYLIGRPVTAAELTAFLAGGLRKSVAAA